MGQNVDVPSLCGNVKFNSKNLTVSYKNPITFEEIESKYEENYNKILLIAFIVSVALLLVNLPVIKKYERKIHEKKVI